jgi:hypothetical protein
VDFLGQELLASTYWRRSSLGGMEALCEPPPQKQQHLKCLSKTIHEELCQRCTGRCATLQAATGACTTAATSSKLSHRHT